MACPCDLVGLLNSSIPGIISAAIDGSTVVDVDSDGVVRLGSTVSRLNISAYAFSPGQNRYLGATCDMSADVSIPWVTKEDCFTGNTYFIPRVGATASTVNQSAAGVSESLISLKCSPGIVSTSLNASASSGPTGLVKQVSRVDGFGLVYNGFPIAIDTSSNLTYTIQLGFLGEIKGHLQSFNFSVSPPEAATVNYTFAFAGVI